MLPTYMPALSSLLCAFEEGSFEQSAPSRALSSDVLNHSNEKNKSSASHSVNYNDLPRAHMENYVS